MKETDGQALSKAWRKWIATEHGKKCLTEPAVNPYLSNRLESAFIEGWEAARQHAAAASPLRSEEKK